MNNKLKLNKMTIADLNGVHAGKGCAANLWTFYECTVIHSVEPTPPPETYYGPYSCYPNSGCLTCGCA